MTVFNDPHHDNIQLGRAIGAATKEAKELRKMRMISMLLNVRGVDVRIIIRYDNLCCYIGP